MAINLHGVGDDVEITLVGDHANDDLELQFTDEDLSVIVDADPILTLPFWMVGDSEQIEITAIDTGTEIATVVRGVNGTTATTHLSGTIFRVEIVAKQIIEIHSAVVTDVWRFIGHMLGAGDGVLRDADPPTFFEVKANSSPDMEFDMLTGLAIVNSKGVYVASTTESDTLVAPSSNPRIDVVEIDEFGAMFVLTGTEAGSPSAPSVTADRLGLAEIYHRVGSVHIDDVDDSSNSYITDKRGDYQGFL